MVITHAGAVVEAPLAFLDEFLFHKLSIERAWSAMELVSLDRSQSLIL
jgi:hypothetical protein